MFVFFLFRLLPLVWHCYLGSILAFNIEIRNSYNLWTKPLNQVRLTYEQFIYVLYLGLVVYISFVMNKKKIWFWFWKFWFWFLHLFISSFNVISCFTWVLLIETISHWFYSIFCFNRVLWWFSVNKSIV